ncbi:hypothetical protein XU18_1619 [Perkinsela sp. CCAP 1560/4]|nr:hypothetical protein XU18_1619 [Perkinsela sp. CCAP 1560/4]|eukprot:KNH07728.1 hypothetical protein XU18_1619 [Perkinsela sp. CCAP 1560/4]
MSDTHSLSDKSESPSDLCISFYASGESPHSSSLPQHQPTIPPLAQEDSTSQPETTVYAIVPGSDSPATNASTRASSQNSIAATGAHLTATETQQPSTQIAISPSDIIRRIVDAQSTRPMETSLGSLRENPSGDPRFEKRPIVYPKYFMDDRQSHHFRESAAPPQVSDQLARLVDASFYVRARDNRSVPTAKSLYGKYIGPVSATFPPTSEAVTAGEADVSASHSRAEAAQKAKFPSEEALMTHQAVSSFELQTTPQRANNHLIDHGNSSPGKSASQVSVSHETIAPCGAHITDDASPPFVETTQPPTAPVRPEELPSISPIRVESLVPPLAVNHHIDETLGEVTSGESSSTASDTDTEQFCRVTRGRSIVLMPDDAHAYHLLKKEQDKKKKNRRSNPHSPMTQTTPKSFPTPRLGTDSVGRKDAGKRAEGVTATGRAETARGGRQVAAAKRQAAEKVKSSATKENLAPKKGTVQLEKTSKKKPQAQSKPTLKRGKPNQKKG